MNALPHLQVIFEKLKSGYHISPEDAELHTALARNPDAYIEYFGALGLRLVRHERDFYYFDPEERDNTSVLLPKAAAFSYILIDHIARQGRPIEETIMATTFQLRGLPHFTLDSYRALLRQVEVYEPDDLKAIVNYFERLGWAKWMGAEEFRFLAIYRVFTKCLELAQQSPDTVKEGDPFEPHLSESQGGGDA